MDETATARGNERMQPDERPEPQEVEWEVDMILLYAVPMSIFLLKCEEFGAVITWLRVLWDVGDGLLSYTIMDHGCSKRGCGICSERTCCYFMCPFDSIIAFCTSHISHTPLCPYYSPSTH